MKIFLFGFSSLSYPMRHEPFNFSEPCGELCIISTNICEFRQLKDGFLSFRKYQKKMESSFKFCGTVSTMVVIKLLSLKHGLILSIMKANICRYEKNQFYRPHHDYFSDTVSHSFLFCYTSFTLVTFVVCQWLILVPFWLHLLIKCFLLQFNLKRGGQRIATMLMYLSDNVEGGETYFPMVSFTYKFLLHSCLILLENLECNISFYHYFFL